MQIKLENLEIKNNLFRYFFVALFKKNKKLKDAETIVLDSKMIIPILKPIGFDKSMREKIKKTSDVGRAAAFNF